ncbi:MAG: L-threonylcarbamoyladenylate synthase [Clostridia bacterium]|nr:L-threonylcarbamoyladenylate synthase [Clostridia bacterium]MDD4386396.1 L-threonylcarbamoyladenylate synthase [Clostridia bacterium]
MNKIGQDINLASKYIINGDIVVFPTETVYGIGADATNKEAVDKIFKAKKRPVDNPIIVHICDLEMLNKVAVNIGEIEKKLIHKFWPGPLSIIFKSKDCISLNVTAGLGSVAVRMPNNTIALELIKVSNKPIAAPSANISSRPSGTCIEDIYEELEPTVSYFIDGGNSEVGIESTVVRVIDGVVNILRPGKISIEDILKVTDKVIMDDKCLNKVNDNEQVLSPGMKHRHYAPSTKCIAICSSEHNNIVNKINELINYSNDNISVMVTSDNVDKIIKRSNVNIIDLGNSLDEVSTKIFSSLRKVDKLNSDICYIQGFELSELGTGIMNRIIRACNHEVIYV